MTEAEMIEAFEDAGHTDVWALHRPDPKGDLFGVSCTTKSGEFYRACSRGPVLSKGDAGGQVRLNKVRDWITAATPA